MKLIDGKAVSQKIKEDLKLRIDQIKAKGERVPGLPWCLWARIPRQRFMSRTK